MIIYFISLVAIIYAVYTIASISLLNREVDELQEEIDALKKEIGVHSYLDYVEDDLTVYGYIKKLDKEKTESIKKLEEYLGIKRVNYKEDKYVKTK